MGKLTLVLSSNLEDLKSNVIKMINEKSDWENVVIVPDRFSLLTELSIFENLKLTSVFNTNVMPISSFASKMLERIGVKYESVNKEEETFLIRRAIQKTHQNFKLLPNNVSAGYCSEIANTISQLKASRVSASNLQYDEQSSLKMKIEDLRLIYFEYEKLLSDKVDSGKLLELFDENIEKIKQLNNLNLYFLGFDSFTTQIFEVIKKLKNHANKIVIGGFYHFEANNKSVFELDIYEKCKAFNKDKDFEIVYGKSTLTKTVKLLYENAFKVKSIPQESNNQINIFSYENAKQEIERTICEIANKIKQDNLRFGDFAIATTNLENYKDFYEIILKKYELNYYLDTSINFSQTAVGEFILLFFNLIINNFDKNLLKSFLSSTFLNYSLTDRSELFVFIDKYFTFNNDLKMLEKHIISNDKDVYNKNKKIFFKLNYYKEKLNKNKYLFEFIDFLKEFIIDFEIEKACLNKAQVLRENNQLKQEKIYLQLFDKLNNILNSLNNYLADEKVSVKEFYELLKNNFETKKVSTVPISNDCVFVGDVTNSYFSKVKHLFLLGADYSSLPQRLEDGGILNDENLNDLERKIVISPKVETINKRNKFKVLNLLSMFEETLTLSYSLLNEDEKNLMPSLLIKDVCKLFVNGQNPLYIKHITSALDNLSFDGQKRSVLKFAVNQQTLKEFLLKNINNPLYKKVVLNSIYSVLKKNNKISSVDLSLLSRDYKLAKIANSKELFFKGNKTKISQLETYFKSPFLHFLTFGLKLQENQTSEINKLDIGNFLHFVAEAFLKRNQQNLSLSESEVEEEVENILKLVNKDESFYKFFINLENRTYFKFLKQEAISLCNIIVSQQKISAFKPKWIEKAFDCDNYFAEAKLGIRGRVDRVDEYGEGFVIYDYKTGKVALNTKFIYTGEKIQLLIYADVYAKESKKQAKGVFYFPVKSSFEDKLEKRMRGVFCPDKENVLNLDNTLSLQKPKSDFIQAEVSTSKANLESGNVQILTNKINDNFHSLIEYAKVVCEKALLEIIDGNIAMREEEFNNINTLFETAIYKKIKDNTKVSVDEDMFKKEMKDSE